MGRINEDPENVDFAVTRPSARINRATFTEARPLDEYLSILSTDLYV
jgi:hypothetical protein